MTEPTQQHPIVAIKSRIAYKNPWMQVREDTTLLLNGNTGLYGVIETNDSVVVAAINDKHEIYVVYGYSYPADIWSWQLPGGGGDNEDLEKAAQRELKEETGIYAEHCELLGNPLIVSCGLLKERMGVVIATGLTMAERSAGTDDLDSIGEGKFISVDEARSMVEQSAICDSQTIAGLYVVEGWIKSQQRDKVI